jgi:plastocyanin
VRRVATPAAGLVLVLVSILALPIGAPQTGVDDAAAAQCLWQRQTKRVVKHVRRHGRLRKIVRSRHRWVCVPQTAPPVLAPQPLVPAPAPPPSASEPEPEANRLAVKSAEYYYVLSRPSVRAGEVTIELDNRGEDPHNLNLRLEDEEGEAVEIPETDSLQRNVATFDLPAGSYRLWCSLPEHEEKGMHTTLLVE